MYIYIEALNAYIPTTTVIYFFFLVFVGLYYILKKPSSKAVEKFNKFHRYKKNKTAYSHEIVFLLRKLGGIILILLSIIFILYIIILSI